VMMEQVFYTRNGALKQESDDEAFSFILRWWLRFLAGEERRTW
jgi:hypothetical protein